MDATRTLTLTEFLSARLDEDEAAIFQPDRTGNELGQDCLGVQHLRGDRFPMGGCHRCGLGPCKERGTGGQVRVLAEVAAKRAIVAEHRPWLSGDYCAAHDGRYFVDDCPTLRALGTVYADHPDYNPDWRP